MGSVLMSYAMHSVVAGYGPVVCVTSQSHRHGLLGEARIHTYPAEV